MKRYIVSIVLAVIIVMGIGSYYLFTWSTPLPNYRLTTVEGDEKEAHSLLIQGSYRYNAGDVYINQQGSDYDSRKPYLTQLLSYNRYMGSSQAQLNRLVSTYHGFMRGKDNSPGFYEDENQLIYAKITDRTSKSLQISVLDKKSKHSRTIEVLVPDYKNYQWSSVEDVQFLDHQLKVMTVNHTDNEDISAATLSSETHLYTIDLDHSEIVNDQLVNRNHKLSGNEELQYVLLSEAEPMTTNSRKIFQIRRITVEQQSRSGNNAKEIKEISSRYVSFDLKNGQEEEISFPSIVLEQNSNIEYYNTGDRLLGLKWSSTEGLHLERFNLNKGSLEPAIAYTIKDLQVSTIYRIQMDNRNLYILGKTGANNQDHIIIISLASGQIVYKGVIVEDGSIGTNNEKNMELSVYNFQIMN